jgi:hypothetical protein
MSDELVELVEGASEDKPSMLNNVIALLVAVTATIMAIANIKDDNIVQAMAKEQAKAVNTWSYFQSKSMKQLLAQGRAETAVSQLQAMPSMTPEGRAFIEKSRDTALEEVKRYETEKGGIKKDAEGHEQAYDSLNVHDDQLDIGEACLTVSIAIFGVGALTQKRWLVIFGSCFAGMGLLMTVAGFAGWSMRPEWLAKFLG